MKTLIVLLGPTGVGKTELSLRIAESLQAHILSADSRQVYKNIPIGTAAPTIHDMARVPHHFVGMLHLQDYYSAATYADQALKLLSSLFQNNDYALLCGGSMMYIDALCHGIDNIPTISSEVRTHYAKKLSNEGEEALCHELLLRDPEYYLQVDRRNMKRIVHALEIIQEAGTTYTSLRKGHRTQRPFHIIKIGLTRPREELFARINQRVETMLEQGWLNEAHHVYPHRALNSLNTVGYKELFQVIDGTWELPFATERIKKNTRLYAKKQLTWFRRDPSIHWFHPHDEPQILQLISSNT